ncbi:sugar ABC transporter ATP-binding protein [Lichenicola sp.]|uniref:sugar ABC transporter ATP-binding protein n=1 Tax=Lichenicola sp. TaxID=2804529 RepID=UPI003B00A1C4
MTIAAHHASDPTDDRTILRLEGITKRFPGVVALDRVDFDTRRGEVHALCGENGAGKSTLMKIISGAFLPDEGTMIFKGQARRFASTLEAEAAGIGIIHQELNLVPHLSVAENIFLAREPRRGPFVDRRRLLRESARCLQRLGVDIDPSASVRRLSVAQQQMVEIAKALSTNAELLIMDEPTSSLTESETTLLFNVIRDLRREGVGIIYISHRLDEMSEIVDRVTVFRDGRYVSTDDFEATNIDAIVSRMVGRTLEDKFPHRTSVPTEDVLLKVDGLTRKGVFHDIGFTVRRGEILGFAGLIGAGRTEVARAIFGADRRDSGTVTFEGRTVSPASPRDAIARGFAYLSEDRKSQGLAIKMSLASNMTLANIGAVSSRAGLLDFSKEADVARRYVDLLNIRTPSIHQVARLLSGGNQQKIIIGKWLFSGARMLFFDEPTRGIDVGAKFAIYQIMDELAAQGIGVVLISSELSEILGMTDRVAVFHQGRIAGILDTAATDQEEIMHYASGRRISGVAA